MCPPWLSIVAAMMYMGSRGAPVTQQSIVQPAVVPANVAPVTQQGIVQPAVVPANVANIVKPPVVASVVTGSTRSTVMSSPRNSSRSSVMDAIQSYRASTMSIARQSSANNMIGTIQSYESPMTVQPMKVMDTIYKGAPTMANTSPIPANMMRGTTQSYESHLKSLQSELSLEQHKLNELTAMLDACVHLKMDLHLLEDDLSENPTPTTCASSDDLCLPRYMVPTFSYEQKPKRRAQHGQCEDVTPWSRGFGTSDRGLLIPFDCTRTSCHENNPQRQPRTESPRSRPRNNSPRRRSSSPRNSRPRRMTSYPTAYSGSSTNLSRSMSPKAMRGGSFEQEFEETFAANVKGYWPQTERTYWPNDQGRPNRSSLSLKEMSQPDV